MPTVESEPRPTDAMPLLSKRTYRRSVALLAVALLAGHEMNHGHGVVEAKEGAFRSGVRGLPAGAGAVPAHTL